MQGRQEKFPWSKGKKQGILMREYWQGLNEIELLSLVLGAKRPSGVTKEVCLARKILEKFDHLRSLYQADFQDFQSISGLNEHHIRSLLAAMELGWRLVENPWPLGQVFKGSKQVFQSFRSQLGRENVEVVWVLLLDSRLRRMDGLEISRGAVNGAIVHPREVLRPVITRQAAAFILVHNHPSGDPQPSCADLSLTRRIAKAARLFQIDFLDHIIIAKDRYVSLAEYFDR